MECPTWCDHVRWVLFHLRLFCNSIVRTCLTVLSLDEMPAVDHGLNISGHKLIENLQATILNSRFRKYGGQRHRPTGDPDPD